METTVLKVSAKSVVNKVAGAIAELVREGKTVEVHAIGAGAVNQSIKALATARGFVASNGLDLTFVPAFIDVQIEGEERTAIKFIVRY